MDDAAINAVRQAMKCLHDGLVKGMWLSDDESAVTFLVCGGDRDGPLYKIRCDGLEWLRINDFQRGNIILAIDVTRTSSLTKSELDSISGTHEIENALALGLGRGGYDRQQSAWTQDKLLVLTIMASYGCVGDVVCRSVSFEECDSPGDGAPPVQRS